MSHPASASRRQPQNKNPQRTSNASSTDSNAAVITCTVTAVPFGLNFGWNPSLGGFMVENVVEGSAAAQHGVKVGDVVTHVEGKPLNMLEQARAALQKDPPFTLRFERRGDASQASTMPAQSSTQSPMQQSSQSSMQAQTQAPVPPANQATWQTQAQAPQGTFELAPPPAPMPPTNQEMQRDMQAPMQAPMPPMQAHMQAPMQAPTYAQQHGQWNGQWNGYGQWDGSMQGQQGYGGYPQGRNQAQARQDYRDYRRSSPGAYHQDYQ